MTRILAIATSLLWLPVLAAAETAVVRSGEHDGFTRLVVYLPETADWTLREEPDRVTLLTGPTVTFDTSAVYTRIGRERAKAVAPGEDREGLSIRLNCRCPVRTETLVGNVVVLDLLDPPARQPEIAARPSVPDAGPHDRVQFPVVSPSRPMEEARRVTELAPLALPEPESPEAVTDLRGFEAEILREVSLAATQGLLSARLTPRAEDAAAATDDSTPQARPPRGDDGMIVHQSTLTPMESPPRPVDAAGIPCMTADRLDVANWGGDDGFAAELGRLRTSLTGEFDEPDPAAALALARFYIAHGFGAEAEAILTLPAPDTADLDILRSMSRIVDLGHDPMPSPFDQQADCEGPAGLWSALAQRTGTMSETAVSSILQALNALPPLLRSHLGTGLASNFVRSGNSEAAESVFRILDRTQQDRTPRADLAQGQLELDHGDRQTGRRLLDRTAGTEGEASPEALLALVRDDLSRGVAVPADVADLLAAYMLQYRNHPLAAQLVETETLARASAGQFDAAFARLQAGGPYAEQMAGITDITDMRSRVAGYLVEAASDPVFLRHVVRLADHPQETISADAADAIADRVLTLGFPELAARVLQDNQPPGDSRTRTQIAARIALRLGKSSQALAGLQRFQGKEIEMLLAEAQAARGDHATASRTYRTLNMVEQADRHAWLAGNWAELAGSEDPLQTALSTLMSDSGAPPGTARGPLSSGRRLLQDSTASRSTIEQMLARYSLSPEGLN